MPKRMAHQYFGVGSHIYIMIVQLKNLLNNMINLFRCF